MRIKKILTILLTLAMVVSLLPATAYAANNTATTMRLEKVQGQVTVSNTTGKAVSQTEHMKLYNGYKLKTGAKSYAWISLDDAKVAKLDANSVVEVQKSGKALTLYIHSGNLFFNAKQPLKGGESFNIKTSTMTTGIRGTSGCVSVVSARVTEINLLTGKLEIVTEHPTLGQKKTAVLLAGQSATSLIDWEAMAVSGEMTEIIIEALTADDVCGNCAIEIAADPDLIARIEKEAPQLLPALIAALAEEKLAADEAADAAKQQQIDDAANNQDFPEDVDPYFEEETGGSGGGGGSSSTPDKEPVAVEVNGWEDAEDGTPGLETQLAAANDGLVDEINVTGEDTVIAVPAGAFNVEPGSDVTLNLGTGTLQMEMGIDPETGEEVGGSIINEGNLTITNELGYIIGSGSAPAVINNEGATLILDIDGAIDANGGTGVENNGTFTMTGGEITDTTGNGMFVVANYGTFVMDGGTISGASYGINNQGTLTLNSGALLQDLNTGVLQDGGSGTATINGATFEGVSQIASNNSTEAVVTQNSIVLKNTSFETYINNYYGTVNIAGGPIGAEGCRTGIYNYGGTVNISGGAHDVYGGITNMSGGGYPAVTNVAEDAVLCVYEDMGIYSTGDSYDAELPAQIGLQGSIVAEGMAIGIKASDTVLTMGANAAIRAKEENCVIQMDALPDGYEIIYEDEYFVLAPIGTGAAIQTVNDAATFSSAVMADTVTQNGGALKLGANITVTTEITASAAKELNIDLDGYTLTLADGGSLINTGKLRIVDSYGGGEIIINGTSIENRGEMTINEGVISGTSDKLLSNSGTLTLNDGVQMDVTGGYGVYNTGKLILNLAENNYELPLDVSGGTGIYSGGDNAELTLNSGYIYVGNNATGMQFNGGTVHLNGGEISSYYSDGMCGRLIVDSTGTGSAVIGAVGTYLCVGANSGGETTPGDTPRDVVQNVYSGTLPEGYYVRYYAYYDEYTLQAYQDAEALIEAVYYYTGKPLQRDTNGDYVYEDLVLSFTEELKLAEDMTINEAAVKAVLGSVATDFGVLAMNSVSSDTGTLQIDLNGHTLTLDVPIAVYGNLTIVDSAGGGKIVTDLDAWYTANADSEAGVLGSVTCSESLIEKTVAAQAEEINEQETDPVESGGEGSPEE